MNTKHLFLSHECLLNHGIQNHPEYAGRLEAILEAIKESRYLSFANLSCDRTATFEDICEGHDHNYVKQVLSFEGKHGIIDSETILTPGSVRAALTAAGIGIELIEKIIFGSIQNGFALVRPPGHHAIRRTGMGFCFFNNIAIAAKKALSLGLKRILILDWDVHHGNGTQDIFYEDDRVLLIDIHQDNLYPKHSGLKEERGRGKGLGYTVNIPLLPSSGDDDYLYAFDMIVEPIVRRYQPELILVSAGFDAHESDPLGQMKVTTKGFGQLTAKAKGLAEKVCNGKIALFLEGGYNPYFLAKNVIECIDVLTTENSSIEDAIENGPSASTLEIVKDIKSIHAC